MALSEEHRRLVGLWAADCAERALPTGAEIPIKLNGEPVPRWQTLAVQAGDTLSFETMGTDPLPGAITRRAQHLGHHRAGVHPDRSTEHGV
jgi:hypothetical protein